MLKTLSLALALGFSGAAIAQQPQPGKGDASGVRSSLCDTVGADIIESCLKQQQRASSGVASEVKDPKQPR